MKLYHGSDHQIKKPIYKFKSATTDYGFGFYMTSDIELAKEWASNNLLANGVVNIYELDTNNLKILDLTSEKYSPLHWVALLVNNRKISDSSMMIKAGKEFLMSHYLINIDCFDLVIGYRADDSYFSFVKAFLRNELPLNQFDAAIRLGKLGKQYFVNSKEAFSKLKFIDSQVVDINTYRIKRTNRERRAIRQYRKLISSSKEMGKTLKDIMEEQNENL